MQHHQDKQQNRQLNNKAQHRQATEKKFGKKDKDPHSHRQGEMNNMINIHISNSNCKETHPLGQYDSQQHTS